MMRITDYGRFLVQTVRHPIAVGAIAPSSPALAREMIARVDWQTVQAAAELGPGTGVFTQEILAARPDRCAFFAVERNGEFVQLLQQRFPELAVHHASVADLPDICRRQGVERLQAIVCGLPWAAFPASLQQDCLNGILRVLDDQGRFSTFAYLQGLLLPGARRFRQLLDEHFSQVECSRVVWRNLPPAIVYHCRK